MSNTRSSYHRSATRISSHALSRWARVDPMSTSAEAHGAILEICRKGRTISTGRGWCGSVAKNKGRGCVAIVWSERPDVAVIVNVKDRVAMTVVTRKGWTPDAPNDPNRLGLGTGSGAGNSGRSRAVSTHTWN
jgi:hypothetical protein